MPILALTGNVEAAGRQASLEAGMNDHVDSRSMPTCFMTRFSAGCEEPRLASLTGRRVLVVDDNAFNREVVTDFLQAVG